MDALLLPVTLFALTKSAYAPNFIFMSYISTAGERSSDSISTVVIDTSISQTGTDKDVITFHGVYTLIALHFYLIENPNSIFTNFAKNAGAYKEFEEIWNDKIALVLVSKDNMVGTDTSYLNGHILEPGKIDKPLSLIWPAFVFLCGPFPFIGNPGIAVLISSFESPLWWAFYSLVLFQFFRFRKTKFLRDPQILLTLIFLLGEIVFSALFEVNLGTSFSHRSIILASLVLLNVRLVQRSTDQKERELKTI